MKAPKKNKIEDESILDIFVTIAATIIIVILSFLFYYYALKAKAISAYFPNMPIIAANEIQGYHR
jgi:heme/copper-type cytochrome/quinol oxidase subunit 2